MSIKFIQTYEDSDDRIEIVLADDPSLEGVFQAFERFLIAAGYCFDGHIELSEEGEEHERIY